MKSKKINKFLKWNKRKTLATTNLILGIIILLYPAVSEILFQHNGTKVINNYTRTVDTFSDEELYQKEQFVKLYNKELNNPKVDKSKVSYVDYMNSGEMLGYLEIPKIDVKLPIFQGISEDILTVGVGHLVKTSLPSEEMNCHVALTAHRGLPSASLFTNLNDLEPNDEFSIISLDKKYTYKVDEIKTVLPKAVDELNIINDKNYATLITCTPYMINTHRLLVRGEFVSCENIKQEDEENQKTIEEIAIEVGNFSGVANEYKILNLKDLKYINPLRFNIYKFIIFVFLILLVISIVFKLCEKKKEKIKND